MNTNRLDTFFELLALNRTMKKLFGDEYGDATKFWRSVIRSTMNETGNDNPISVVIPIAKRLSAEGNDPALLLSAAVDLSSEP